MSEPTKTRRTEPKPWLSAEALTVDRVREALEYDPATGIFTWRPRAIESFKSRHHGKIWNVRYAGKTAGSVDGNGYVSIRIDGGHFKAHRLAWMLTHGVKPAGEVDHINGVKTDNRICNLRDVPKAVNMQNIRSARSACGLLGVHLHKPLGKWLAQISIGGVKKHIGVFATPEEAHAAYVAAKRQYHEGCTL